VSATLPRSRATDRRYYGVLEAIVDKVEGDPAKEGRVKLRFPRFDGGREVSDWCRVAQLYAGGGYGSFFPPEKGDEVLVAFVQGDMRIPIVLGGLYNGQDKPATSRDGGKDQKLIRTRGGHQVLLDDTSSDKAVRITTAAGHAVHLDDTGNQVVVETPKGRVKITLADGGTVTVSATTVKIEARTIELGAPGATEPAVLGNALMTLFNTHTHTLAAPVPIPTTPPIVPMTPALQLSQNVKVAQL
jgi:uncharacterized protein involved in type VI secretion and phage assembly